MSQQIRQIIIFSAIALFIYGVWQYFFNKEELIQDKPFTKGYSIENLELKITDDLGKLTGKFISPSLVRYTDSTIMHINKPLFWTYKDGVKHWEVKSNIAEFNPAKNEINFLEELVAKTINDDSITEFTANSLLIDLKNNLASTKDGIYLKQQNFAMTGQIAQFNLKNETLEVNNNVKAVYKSTKKTK